MKTEWNQKRPNRKEDRAEGGGKIGSKLNVERNKD
jgi:hypothetical protein